MQIEIDWHECLFVKTQNQDDDKLYILSFNITNSDPLQMKTSWDFMCLGTKYLQNQLYM